MNNLLSKQLKQLIVAHFKEIIREPGILFWGILFPILMSLGLGVAFTKKADSERHIAVLETSLNVETGSISQLQLFLKAHSQKTDSVSPTSNYFITIPNNKIGNTTFIFQSMSWEEAMVDLKRGNINMILSDSAGRIHYHFDPANTDAQLNYLKLSKLFETHQVSSPDATASIEPLTMTGTRYIDFLIPGLIGMGIMMSSMWGLSYGMIERRSKKLLRRMVATPMKKSNFMFSIMIVRMTMNFVEAGLLVLFAWLVFDIQIQGNIASLLAVFISGNMAFAGIAILMASRTSKTEIGNGLINVVVFPMMILSGVFFSYHNFPDWAIPYIQKLPLTLLADGIRSIFIEGAGFAEVGLSICIMASTGIVFFGVGMKIFKWY